MITYLLHGGKTSKNCRKNDIFFSQFTSLVDKNEVKILLCYWARNPRQWPELAKRDMDKIKTNTEKLVKFEIVKNPDDLFSKLKDYEVLYVSGGEPEFLEPFYSQLKDLKKMLDSKIYIGSSMGTFMASSSYIISFSSGSDSITKGLDLLPIQTLCHWDIETNKIQKLNLLKENSNLPIITLDECQTIKIYS
jgi:peptidase E